MRDANDQPVEAEGRVKLTRDYWYEIWLDPTGKEIKGEELKGLRAEFAARRDYLIPALRELGFVIPGMPEGAFYVYADVAQFSTDSFAFCTQVLHGAGVAITPGRDFGDNDAHKYVRLTYTIGIPALREVVARLKAFLKP